MTIYDSFLCCGLFSSLGKLQAASHKLRVSNNKNVPSVYRFQTDSSAESDCSEIEDSSVAGFVPIRPGMK